MGTYRLVLCLCSRRVCLELGWGPPLATPEYEELHRWGRRCSHKFRLCAVTLVIGACRVLNGFYFFFLRPPLGPIHRCSNFLHVFGDDFRYLHHLLAQCRVFLNLALNAFAISLQRSPQPLKLTNETINFAR